MQHYINSSLFGFSKVNCGHCKKKLMKLKDCGCFEESNIKQEQEITIMQKIHLYNRKINEMSNILETLITLITSLENEAKNH